MSRSKPLSPHLQVYRPQLTSVLSITHRASGVFLAAGTVVLLYWLLAAAGGARHYAEARALLDCWLSKLALLGWTWAFFYHLCNGVRHLAWDAGYGFDLKTVYRTGYTVVCASIVLTGLVWACVVAQLGGAP
ncbi:MAG: succinate dehydrogenase, cytochrome b556 subunit [Gammaproteobacteria bacterium]